MRAGVDCLGRQWEERELVTNIMDISGKRFNMLTALFPVISQKRTYWLCKCDCGNEIVCRADGLKTGHTKSCGCWKITRLKTKDDDMRRDMIGMVFEYLTVLALDCFKERANGTSCAYYKCQCVCGNIVSVSGNSLRSNLTKSCGCRTSEMISNSLTNDLTNKRFGKLTVLCIDRKTDNKVFWKCQCDCGNIVSTCTGSLVSGHTQSCGCVRSVGERNIQSVLIQNNIVFEKECAFSDLVSQKGGFLRYDFGIIKDSEIVRLIEFDGRQHEYPIDFFGGQDRLLQTQQNDALKNQYAISHNIPLVRIPYTKRDSICIDDILGDKYLITI